MGFSLQHCSLVIVSDLTCLIDSDQVLSKVSERAALFLIFFLKRIFIPSALYQLRRSLFFSDNLQPDPSLRRYCSG